MFFKGVLTDPSKRWYANINLFYKENEIDHLSSYLINLNKFSENNSNLYVIILPYEFQTRN